MPTTPTTAGRRRSHSRAIAAVVLAALVLAGCGSSSGDAKAKPTTTEAKAATTTTEAKETTTTEADGGDSGEAPDGLPTEEADAPQGDWISVRFLVAVEPEPDDFNKGSAEARLYDVKPDCSGGDACSLDLAPGGGDDNFAMPDTEPIGGDDITLEPDGDEWTDSYTYPDDIGCTDQLDGPYLSTTEERTMKPVYNDSGDLTGLVGTVLLTDSLTAAGRAAGCPASSEATYAYAVVAAPNDGIDDIDEYTVDGDFKQTLEITKSENQTNPQFQKGQLTTTLPKYDAKLAGSCEAGTCSVEFAQLNGQNDTRRTELVSKDGRSLTGTYDEDGGCADADGKVVLDEGAYDATGAYEDLTPIWVEDGEVKAFVGKYYRVAEPTAAGKAADPSCTKTETIEAWVYLVDTDVLG